MAALANSELAQIRKTAMWDAAYATEVAIKVTEMIENINKVCDPAAKESDYFMSFSVSKTVVKITLMNTNLDQQCVPGRLDPSSTSPRPTTMERF